MVVRVHARGRIRQIHNHLNSIESRITALEHEAADLVNDLWYLDDIINVTKAFRECLKELRRQLWSLDSH
jgi:hypothetical protein